ncbi:MAG: 3-demethylubiquinone-9 3-O-methyltransferase [Deltaproteobacteria bacterium]|nr:3-demethylubiquinone-9 3-O-methyltransferase [Deltaproteobacteria bacterium]
MAADNTIYDRLADSWWEEQGVLGILRTAVNPARAEYFGRILSERLRGGPRSARGLDVGCGGGILTEALARLGCTVVGIDRSRPSLRAARAHAAAQELPVGYFNALAEALPFEAASFDFVSCCDVLEHVTALRPVISEVARVLRPGGLFLYDTVNRTLRSNVVAIRFAQQWRWSRFLPPRVHEWRQFVKPRELTEVLEENGLEQRQILGMAPGAHPLRIALLAIRLRRGRMSYSDFGKALRYRLTADTSVSYLGYATRR